MKRIFFSERKADTLFISLFGILLLNTLVQVIFLKNAKFPDFFFVLVFFFSCWFFQLLKDWCSKQSAFLIFRPWIAVVLGIAAVIFSCLTGVLLCHYSIFSDSKSIFSTIMIVSILIFYIIFILYSIIELALLWKLKEYSKNAIVFIVVSIVQIIIMFSLIYASIYSLDSSSFSGTFQRTSFGLFFDFVYFSIVTFTTLGYGDIVPVSSVAKCAVSVEALIFVVYISIFLMYLTYSGKEQHFGGSGQKCIRSSIYNSQEGESIENDN